MKGEKIKGLRPSHREKKRYILFSLFPENDYVFKDVNKAISSCLHEYLGIKGMKEVGLVFNSKLFVKNMGILRVSTKSLNDVKEGLEFLQKIGETKVILKIKLVSGVLKKCKEIIIA